MEPFGNTQGIIVFFAVICLIIILALIFSRQIKIILKPLITGLFLSLAALLLNMLLLPAEIAVGLNLVNFGFMSLLGIPGFLTLYMIQLVL